MQGTGNGASPTLLRRAAVDEIGRKEKIRPAEDRASLVVDQRDFSRDERWYFGSFGTLSAASPHAFVHHSRGPAERGRGDRSGWATMDPQLREPKPMPTGP